MKHTSLLSINCYHLTSMPNKLDTTAGETSPIITNQAIAVPTK